MYANHLPHPHSGNYTQGPSNQFAPVHRPLPNQAGTYPNNQPNPLRNGHVPFTPNLASFRGNAAPFRNDQPTRASITMPKKFAKLEANEKQRLNDIKGTIENDPVNGLLQLIHQFIEPTRSRKGQKCAMDLLVNQLATRQDISPDQKAHLAGQFFERIPNLHTSAITARDAQLRGIDAARTIYNSLPASGRLKVAPSLARALPRLAGKMHWWDKDAFKKSSHSRSDGLSALDLTPRGPNIIILDNGYYGAGTNMHSFGHGGGGFGGGCGDIGDCGEAGLFIVPVVIVAAVAGGAALYGGAKVAATRANKQINVGATQFAPLLQDAYQLARQNPHERDSHDFYRAMAPALQNLSQSAATRPKIADLNNTLAQQHNQAVRPGN